MSEALHLTTLSVDAHECVATPVHDRVATPHLSGVDMDKPTRGRSGQNPAKGDGQKGQSGQPAGRTGRRQRGHDVQDSTPQTGGQAPEVSTPGDPVGGALLKLFANIPPAGEGIDPEAKGPRSFHVRKRTLERLRAAVYWLAQTDAPVPSNVSELVDQVLLNAVDDLEKKYNDGKPFPAAPSKLRTGPGSEGVARISDYHARKREGKDKEGPGDDG